MGNFNKFDKGRGGSGGGRGGFGGGRSFGGGGGRRFGGRGDGPVQMHPATCSKCGQSCEVPFRPTGDRPVFCNNCFKSQGDASPRFAPKSFGGDDRGRNFGGNAIVNTNASTGGTVTKAQIDALNVKLDKILSLLASTKTEVKPKTEAPAVKEKKEVAKKEKAPAKKSSPRQGGAKAKKK